MLFATLRRASAALLALGLPAVALAQSTGSVFGTVVDHETGETLIGVNIRVEDTTTGTVTDLDGAYEIRGLAAGTYRLTFSYIGYQNQTVTGVAVTAGGRTKVDIELSTGDVAGQEVVVEVRALRDTDASLLADRQRALVVSDAISAETISRSGSSNVADAMQRVTGASVEEGKYIVIRGLGDRYTTTQLNGVELPSADPSRRSFQMDLIPSSLLDNVVTTKTFTPDKPGNFTGGAVDVTTRDYPDGPLATLSLSGSFNSIATGADGFLASPALNRSVPGILDGASIPTFIEARTNAEAAQQLDAYSRAFVPAMAPTTATARPNGSASLALGNAFNLGGDRRLGVLGSLSYGSSNGFYDDGVERRWVLGGPVATEDRLLDRQNLTDRRGTTEETWGAYGTVAYRFSRNHELGLRLVGTTSAESQARVLQGSLLEGLAEDQTFQARALSYSHRTLRSAQVRGEHAFGASGDVRLDWKASLAATEQDEPDLRFFSNDFRVDGTDTTFAIDRALYDEPTRFFRNARENAANGDLTLALPLLRLVGLRGTFKTGLSYQTTDRRFREQRYSYAFSTAQVGCPAFTYDGNAAAFYGEDHLGIVGQNASGRPCFGNIIEDRTDRRNAYDGSGTVAAAFAMADALVAPRLRLVGGVRYETTDLRVASLDTTLAPGRIEKGDLLPALGLVYEAFRNANVRLSYGRTLARPTFREFGPFASFDFIGDFIYEGNPNLQRTLVDNLDGRVEWFPRPGDLFAVSLFAKRLERPIEFVFDVATRRFTNRNVPEGRVFGAEFEVRRGIDLGSGRTLQPGLNVSLIRSEVDVDSTEAADIRALDPDGSIRRPLFGQSPFLVNAELTYADARRSASLFYNVFGPRLASVVYGATPDVYEQPRHSLDFTFSQALPRGLRLKLSAKNLLDARERSTLSYRDETYVYRERGLGRTFSLGVSATLF